LHAGFQFDPENAAHRDSGNASRYTIYRLPYTPRVTGEGALWPEIQIETAVWPLRLPSVERSVTSFWAEAFKQRPEVPSIPCVALVETIAEKFVALTRRAGAELADAGGPRDKTIVRHAYDLHVIRSHYDPAEVIALAREIMRADVEVTVISFPHTAKIRLLKLCGRSVVSRSMIVLPATMRSFCGTWFTAKPRILRRRSLRYRLWLIA
jgi:hypothetical protein